MVDEEAAVLLGISSQPNQPGVLQREIDVGFGEVDVGFEEADVREGAGTALGDVLVVVEEVVVVESLHPNHPGVSQVVLELELVLVELVDGVPVVVVVSSKHPHQPGVLHVSVLVRVLEVAVDVLEILVEVSVPLLSKNFHM